MILAILKIGSLKNHFHLRHDDVKELHHKHAQEKTELLLLEKEVCLLKCSGNGAFFMNRNEFAFKI